MIHRYWTGNAPIPTSSTIAKNILVNTVKVQVRDWTDENLPAHIVEAADSMQGFVPKEYRLLQRSNIVRLFLLRDIGGVYIDHDFVLFRMPRTIEVASHYDSGTVCNCYMAFPKDNPLINEAISKIAPNGRSSTSSGAAMLNTIIEERYRVRLPYSQNGLGSNKDMWGIHLYDSQVE